MSKFVQYLNGLLLLLLAGCGSSIPKEDKVLAIKEMGALATTEYTVTKIVKASDNQTWYKIGDRKILLSVEASLKAGIDLTQLSKDDITSTGKSIRIKLPPPKLLSVQLPPEKIRLEYEEVGLLRSEFSQEEKTALLAQAEKQIEAAIPETGILETARTHTRDWITRFCQQLGYEEINIEFTDQPTSILR